MSRRLLLCASIALSACGSAETGGLDALRFSVSEDLIQFGEVAVGGRAEASVEVLNESSSALLLRAQVGDDWSDDLDFSPATLDLAPGAKRTLRLSFAPTASGPVASTLVLRSDDARVLEVPLRLQGTGISGCEDLEVSPLNVNFGPGVIGTEQVETITLRNVGEAPLEVPFEEEDNVGDCDGASGNVTDFCVAQDGLVDFNGDITIAPGASVELQAAFRPVVATNTSGFFTVRAAEACDAIPVGLSGRGVDSGLACTARLDFGKVFPGDCKTLPFECENLANAPVVISTVEKRRGDPMSSALIVAAGLPHTLEEGETVTFEASYCPTDVGTLNTRIEVQAEGIDRVDIDVVAEAGGANLEVRPEVIDFGEVAALAPARTLVEFRNSGFEDLEVTGIEFGSMDLSADQNGLSLAPGEVATVTVELQSLQAGAVATTMTVRSNDPDTPVAEFEVLAEAFTLPPCNYRADMIVDLGAVEPGRSAFRFLEIENTGTDDCLITSLRTVPGGDDEVFLADESAGPGRIAAGEVRRVRVGFTPLSAGTFATSFELGVSSRTRPFTQIVAQGTSQADLPLVYPQQLDFTTLGAGCGSRGASFRIHDRAGGLVIDAISVVGPAGGPFSLRGAPSFPQSVPTNGALSFDVDFATNIEGAYRGTLRIQATQAGAPFDTYVELRGVRQGGLPRVAERFVQADAKDLDVLMALDWSGGTNGNRLGPAGLAPLVMSVTAAGKEAHVAAVADRAGEGGVFMGDPNRRFADSADNDAATVYQSILTTPLSGFVEPFSQFRSAELGLSAPALINENAGFLRPEARLGLVISARTAERSPRSIEYYTDFFRSLKGADRMNEVSASAFAGPSPSGCRGNVFASATPRVEALVRALGGRFEVYCEPTWNQPLTEVGLYAAGLRDIYFLKAPVEADSLEVRIDGVVLPAATTGGGTNYTYDAARQAVVFAPAAVPVAGADIDVGYTPSCP